MCKKITFNVIYAVEDKLFLNNCPEIKSVWCEESSLAKRLLRLTENTLGQEVLRIFRKVGWN